LLAWTRSGHAPFALPFLSPSPRTPTQRACASISTSCKITSL
jgi:hypothetical protein